MGFYYYKCRNQYDVKFALDWYFNSSRDFFISISIKSVQHVISRSVELK